MRGRSAPILLALLLATPLASAGWFSTTTVHVAPYHMGDALRYDGSWGATGGKDAASTTNWSRVLRLEGPGHALDAYGIDRSTLDVREDDRVEGNLTASVVCHMLAGGFDVVREDYLVGGYEWKYHFNGTGTGLGLPLLDTPASDFNESFNVGFGDCGMPGAIPGSYQEGQRVRLGDLLPGSGSSGEARSDPAVATTFHGRDALVLGFDVRDILAGSPFASRFEGRVSLTLADGLPGVVADDERILDRVQDSQEAATWALTGFEAAQGAALAIGNASLPARNPTGEFRPFERLRVDDSAFGLAYPYDEAIANLQADPTVGFSSWLSSHPDASLVFADYERGAGGDAVRDAEGAWTMAFSDGHASQTYYTARGGAVMGLGAGLPAAAKPASDAAWHTELPARVDPAKIPELAASQTVRDVAQRQGLDVARLQHIAFYDFDFEGIAAIGWNIADISGTGGSNAQGSVLQIDATTGAATAVAQALRTSDPGSPLAQPIHGTAGVSRASALSALAGPGAGAGLAGGAITGLAVLLLLLKFVLIPLFTRLRRDGLLDNPVRARLYERVRAEPGIHLAELVDFAGIGEGATRHHMDQLVTHRLVARLQEEKFVRYYAAGEVPPDIARREALLRAGSMRAVYDLYCAQPGLTLREAGARLGLSAPSVHRCKKRLEKAGLLPAAAEARVSAAA